MVSAKYLLINCVMVLVNCTTLDDYEVSVIVESLYVAEGHHLLLTEAKRCLAFSQHGLVLSVLPLVLWS